MNLRRLLNLTFAVFVTAGLVLAPMAAPAAATHAQAGSMADMPCCPGEQQGKDCQDCPLIAMCILTTAQAAPLTASALPLRHPVRTTHSFHDDVLMSGLARPPPDHPPRSLV